MLNNIRYANIYIYITPTESIDSKLLFRKKNKRKASQVNKHQKSHFLQEICYKVKKYQQLAK